VRTVCSSAEHSAGTDSERFHPFMLLTETAILSGTNSQGLCSAILDSFGDPEESAGLSNAAIWSHFDTASGRMCQPGKASGRWRPAQPLRDTES
jgi:hypothetical protein